MRQLTVLTQDNMRGLKLLFLHSDLILLIIKLHQW